MHLISDSDSGREGFLRQERPLSSLYALAEVCGVSTAPPFMT